MSLVLQSSGGGQITIQEPTTASNFTQTLPAATGTVMVSGNMPAFSAYQSSAQTLSTSTLTKLTFTTEEFDTNNNFASSTFTPTVAGYYQVNGGIQVATARCDVQVLIYKTGAVWKQGGYGTSQAANTVSALVYCNGSTDYIDLYGLLSTGQALNASAAQTYFQACLIRSA